MSINAHTFNVSLATEMGLNQAILLQHLYYWHQINEKKKHNIKDGKVWTYNTVDGFAKIFPYLTAKQISYAFKKLEEEGYIETANYNKAAFDRTKWYSLTENAISLFVESNLQNVKCKLQKVKSKEQNVVTIPDSNTDNNTNNNNSVLDVPSDTDPDKDFYGKIYYKIVDAYPANRIGNRKHGQQKFRTLSKEDAKLAALNLKRYLTIAGPYVKSLQNYITEGCFTESWLKAEEETKSKKTSTTNKPDTKNFDTNY